jgi:hypothetical protein
MADKEKSREIRSHIRRVLMEEWDPIGVSDIPEAADEYDGYIGGVYELLDDGASEQEIAAHLRGIEVREMEMIDWKGAPLLSDRKRDSAVSSLRKLISK